MHQQASRSARCNSIQEDMHVAEGKLQSFALAGLGGPKGGRKLTLVFAAATTASLLTLLAACPMVLSRRYCDDEIMLLSWWMAWRQGATIISMPKNRRAGGLVMTRL